MIMYAAFNSTVPTVTVFVVFVKCFCREFAPEKSAAQMRYCYYDRLALALKFGKYQSQLRQIVKHCKTNEFRLCTDYNRNTVHSTFTTQLRQKTLTNK